MAGKPVGVVKAKKVGTTLSGVAEQTAKYQDGIPDIRPQMPEKPPFAYESTGVETFFRDQRDPQTRSRRVFCFHRPEALRDWSEQGTTLRASLAALPARITDGLRECQVEAVSNLERSFGQGLRSLSRYWRKVQVEAGYLPGLSTVRQCNLLGLSRSSFY